MYINLKYFFTYFVILFSSSSIYASNASLPDTFPLEKLTLVGAHNAAQSSKEGWVYAQQSETLENLFKAGARFFKVPIHWYDPSQGFVGKVKTTLKKIGSVFKISSSEKKPPFIALCHEFPGHNNCRLSILQRGGKEPQSALQFFQRLSALAAKNPKEIMILKLEEYLLHNSEKNGTKDYSKEKVIAELNSLLEKSGLARVAFKLKGSKLPTLGEMRKEGKNVIIFSGNRNIESGSPYLSLFGNFVNQTHWETDKLANCGMASHKSGNLLTEVGINPEVSIPHHNIEGRILSATHKLGIKTGIVTPTKYKELHSQENIKKRLDTCEGRHGFQGNILSSDHIQHGELHKFATERNKKIVAQLSLK